MVKRFATMPEPNSEFETNEWIGNEYVNEEENRKRIEMKRSTGRNHGQAGTKAKDRTGQGRQGAEGKGRHQAAGRQT